MKTAGSGIQQIPDPAIFMWFLPRSRGDWYSVQLLTTALDVESRSTELKAKQSKF